ncbi:endonuclease domain-containing protein [Demequina sp. NBRC 110057]|uniref:endonuclease domain-containing protein n=1 Tax=Demequina sp. NBRC 110057 TaxID=1570346 RepID=UPI001177DE18|nr:DUF559 domain-containing protein [Demequina sp. NBRC 110057]
MDVIAALRRCGSVARTRDLAARGCTPAHVAAAMAKGQVVAVSRGLVALPDADPARLVAARLHGTVTCGSALVFRGVALAQRPEKPHVEVGRNRGGTAPFSQQASLHFSVHASKPRLAHRMARVPEALDAAGRCLSPRDHLVAVDSALHQGLVRPDQVAAFVRSTRERRDWLLSYMDGRAESPPETWARFDLASAGIPVHPQRYIPGVGRVDMVAANRVVVEADGRQFHDDQEAFQRDRTRDRELARLGYTVLRFTYRDLAGPNAVSVAAAVRAVLGS